jgi:hypothetical protein
MRQATRVDIASDVAESEVAMVEEAVAELSVEMGDNPREQGLFAMEYRRFA